MLDKRTGMGTLTSSGAYRSGRRVIEFGCLLVNLFYAVRAVPAAGAAAQHHGDTTGKRSRTEDTEAAAGEFGQGAPIACRYAAKALLLQCTMTPQARVRHYWVPPHTRKLTSLFVWTRKPLRRQASRLR